MSVPIIGQGSGLQVGIEYDPVSRVLIVKRGIDWTVIPLSVELVQSLHDGFKVTLQGGIRVAE